MGEEQNMTMFRNGDTPFVHPVTGRVIGPGEWYEGAAHVETEPLKDEKELAAIHKEEAKRRAEAEKQAEAEEKARKKAKDDAEKKRQQELKEAEERARALAEQNGGAGEQ